MTDALRVMYLHGFASSPAAQKGRMLAAALAPRGLALEVPDLNLPSFEALSVRAQHAALADDLRTDGRPTVLIGSSLGGYLATLLAPGGDPGPLPTVANVRGLVLLAPAFDLGQRWRERLGPEACARWARDGAMAYSHWGYKKTLPVHYAFLEEFDGLPGAPGVEVPVVVIQGRRDETVPHTQTRAWVDQHPRATLIEVDDEHQLTGSLRRIEREVQAFLSGLETPEET